MAIIICKYGIKHLANTNTYFVSFQCESMFLLECGKFTQEKRSMVKHGFNIEGGWRRRKTHVASSPKSSDTISLTFSSVSTNRKYVWHLLNRHTVYDSWWPSQRIKTCRRFNSSSLTALWVIRQLEGVWHKPILILGSLRWLFAADFRKEAALMSCFSWANKRVKLLSSQLNWLHWAYFTQSHNNLKKYDTIMQENHFQNNLLLHLQARSCIKHQTLDYSFVGNWTHVNMLMYPLLIIR